MATKPSSKLNWIISDDPTKIAEPPTSKKNTGWEATEKPPFQWFNWIFNIIHKWNNYFETTTDELISDVDLLTDAVDDLDSGKADASALTAHESDTSTHGVSGDIIGSSDTQVVTNKDIDGGAAANTRRITVPKGNSAALAGLTRKQGTVLYDTDLLKLLVDNGTNLQQVLTSQVLFTSGDLTLTSAHNGYILNCDTSVFGFPIAITLPALTSSAKNFSFTIKDVEGTFGSNSVTVIRSGSERIEDAAANYVCNKPYRAYTFTFDGTNWYVTSTSFDSKSGAGDFVGEGGTQTADGNNATGLNVIGDTNSRYAQIIQQRKTTSSQSFGLLVQAGTSGSDIAQLWKNAAGSNLGKYRGDGIFELIAGGLAFPVTQVPSSDANVLDDYEEGTWTPQINFGGGAAGITYASRTGSYTKFGNICIARAWIQLSSKGSSTGDVGASLPFTTKNATSFYQTAIPGLRSALSTLSYMYVNPNASEARLVKSTEALLNNNDFSNGSYFAFTAIFETN